MAIDINQTIPFFDPLVNTIGMFVGTIRLLVGGIFGLYLILVYLRWREYRILTRLMREMRNEMAALNQKLGVTPKKVRDSRFEKKIQKIEKKLHLR